MAAEAKQQVDKLLTRANALRAAGDLTGAEAVCKEALQLDKRNPATIELLGDLLLARGQAEQAMKCFQAALHGNPRRAALEDKLGLAALKRDERRRLLSEQQQLLEHPDLRDRTERNPALSFLLSALIPGAGQLYNGDYAKGVALLVVSLFAFALLRDSLYQVYLDLLKSMRPGGGGAFTSLEVQSVGSLFWLLVRLFLLAGTWTYSLVEAPIRAGKLNREREARLGLA